MAVSLGTRVSALLFVGAIAVATAAVTEAGGSAGRGSGGTNVSGGTAQDSGKGSGAGSGGALSGGPVAETPSAAPSPGPSALGSGGAKAGGGAPRAPRVSRTPSPSTSTTAAPAVPAWLPPGPASPDADHRPDPDSVYDLLRSPDRCRDALGLVPRASVGDEWTVLRGLAHACLAVQGREGGSWAAAERDHAALTGRLNTCKGRAAQRVLAGLLAFHRSRPSVTARLTDPPATATPACAYAIASVDVGGDGEARPGDPLHIELRGTYFDHAELLREGTVLVGDVQVAGPLHAVARSGDGDGDGLVLATVVPDLGPGAARGPAGVTVSVRYAATEAVRADAFRVPGPEVSGPTQKPGASGSPGLPDAADSGSTGLLGSPGPRATLTDPLGDLGSPTALTIPREALAALTPPTGPRTDLNPPAALTIPHQAPTHQPH
ncbi:hypothetical protein [Streptomyces sp. T028]|uniref:hypothetical protein n=1 Tax=Streptomyces sp. T028 TaxID=3394379 RepID=UPI003A899432